MLMNLEGKRSIAKAGEGKQKQMTSVICSRPVLFRCPNFCEIQSWVAHGPFIAPVKIFLVSDGDRILNPRHSDSDVFSHYTSVSQIGV